MKKLTYSLIILSAFIVSVQAQTKLIEKVDRKSTRLNSSHTVISYAVFCLKKKKKNIKYSHTERANNIFGLKKIHEKNIVSKCGGCELLLQTSRWDRYLRLI